MRKKLGSKSYRLDNPYSISYSIKRAKKEVLLQIINLLNPGILTPGHWNGCKKQVRWQIHSEVLQSINFPLGKSWDYCRWGAKHANKSFCVWLVLVLSPTNPLLASARRRILNQKDLQIQWLLILLSSLLIGEARTILASTHLKHIQTENNPTYNCLFFTNNYLEGFKHLASASTCSLF